MFAVIKTGGKQYRIAPEDQFTIERLPGEAGDAVTFSEVLMVGTTIGAPFVAGASVTAEIVEQTRGPKVLSFKKRRRQNSKRIRGHRQDLTLIRIGQILTDGQSPSKTASAKPAAAGTDEVADATPAGEMSGSGTQAETAAPQAEAAEAPAKKPRAAKKAKADDADNGAES